MPKQYDPNHHRFRRDRVVSPDPRNRRSPVFSEVALAQIMNGVMKVPWPRADTTPDPEYAAYVKKRLDDEAEFWSAPAKCNISKED